MDVKRYITTTQAAEVIGVTTSRVRQMIRTGELRSAIRLGGAGYVILDAEAQRLRDNPATTGRKRGGRTY